MNYELIKSKIENIKDEYASKNATSEAFEESSRFKKTIEKIKKMSDYNIVEVKDLTALQNGISNGAKRISALTVRLSKILQGRNQ